MSMVDGPVQSVAVILSTLCFLYGIYTVLFLVCIHTLLKQKRRRYLLHCLSMSSLFVLATASLIYNAKDVVQQALPGYDSDRNENIPVQCITMILANIIADVVLIWRCYTVWGSSIKIIVFPTILCVAATVLRTVVLFHYSKYVGTDLFAIPLLPQTRAYHGPGNEAIRIVLAFVFITTLANLLITVLIAGRIYFITREVSGYLEQKTNKMYRTVTAIVIESGSIHPLALIVYASSVLVVLNGGGGRVQLLVAVVQAALNQTIGIAPTLIIVRLGLGISVDSVEQTMLSTMRAEQGCKFEDSSHDEIRDAGMSSESMTVKLDVERQTKSV